MDKNFAKQQFNTVTLGRVLRVRSVDAFVAGQINQFRFVQTFQQFVLDDCQGVVGRVKF